MNKLLFDEYPLLIPPTLAQAIGLNEAIVVQQVHYWIQSNKRNKQNSHKGHTWTFNSIESWQEQFPFWSVSTVKRIFKKLEDDEILIVDNFNKLKFDRTKWYRINYKKLTFLAVNVELAAKCQSDPMEGVNLTPTIPETTQRIPRQVQDTYSLAVSENHYGKQ